MSSTERYYFTSSISVQQDLSNAIDFNLEIDHPSDRGNFKINFSSDLKTILAKHGSCQPKCPVVVNGKNFTWNYIPKVKLSVILLLFSKSYLTVFVDLLPKECTSQGIG